MALITLHRSPSGSGHSTPTKDEECLRRSRFQRRHSFVMVKGAALLLQEEEEEADGPPSALHKTHKRNKSAQDQDLQQRSHLQAMVDLLRPEDSIKLAVRLESVKQHRIRYILVVSKMGCSDEDETILLGVDFPKDGCNHCTIGMVLPVWSNTQVFLDGDGGFSVTSDNVTRIFKPISVQTMWSMMQVLHKACESAFLHNHFPASSALGWVQHYEDAIASDQSCINEWTAMSDLLSVRPDSPAFFTEEPSEREITEHTVQAKLREVMMTTDLENSTSKEIRNELERRMNCNLKEYKEFIDNEMLMILAQMDRPSRIFDYLYLGSEWNASNMEELQKNGVSHIVNVTREIDNFFPESLKYLNVRVYDEETTDLLSHWKETYRFISNARKQNTRVLVHCKMGVSRSGSTVIAYAMKEYGWSLEEALRYVKEKRSIVNPNPGFMRQLLIYQGILDASKQRHSDLWERKTKCEQSDSPGQTIQGGPDDNGAMPERTAMNYEKPSPIEEEGSSETEESEEEEPQKSPPYCFRPLEGLEQELGFLAMTSPGGQAEELTQASTEETVQPSICLQRMEEEGESGNVSDDSNAEEIMSHLGGTQHGLGQPSSLAVPASPLTPRRQRINLWSVMRSISQMETSDQETAPRSPAENTNNCNSAVVEVFESLPNENPIGEQPSFTDAPHENPIGEHPSFTDAPPPPISFEDKSEGGSKSIPTKLRRKKRLPRQTMALMEKETGTHAHRPHSGVRALPRLKVGDKKLLKQVSYQPQVGKVRKQARVLDKLRQNPQGLGTTDWQNCGGAGGAAEDVLPGARPRLKHLQSVAELKKAALVSRQTKAFESSQRLQQKERAYSEPVEEDVPSVPQGATLPDSFHPEDAVSVSDSQETCSAIPELTDRLLDSSEKVPAVPKLERSTSGPRKMVRWENVEVEEIPPAKSSNDHKVGHENGAS